MPYHYQQPPARHATGIDAVQAPPNSSVADDVWVERALATTQLRRDMRKAVYVSQA